MADAQEEPQPPPKEKKKKKSSSVKSNKSATEEAPQLNGAEVIEPAVGDEATPAQPPPPDAEAPAEADAATPPADQGGSEEQEVVQEVIEDAPPPVEEKLEPVKEDPPPQPQLTEKQIQQEVDALALENKHRELAEGFFLVDFNKDGQIDKSDLQMTLTSLGILDVSDEEIDGMLGEASSPLDVDAFIALMGSEAAELDPEDLLVKALSSWDMDSSGYISKERIRRDLMTWGDVFTEEEVDNALEDAPVYAEPQGAMIDYVEFCKILSGSASQSNWN